jgi:hypothetical protein
MEHFHDKLVPSANYTVSRWRTFGKLPGVVILASFQVPIVEAVVLATFEPLFTDPIFRLNTMI